MKTSLLIVVLSALSYLFIEHVHRRMYQLLDEIDHRGYDLIDETERRIRQLINDTFFQLNNQTTEQIDSVIEKTRKHFPLKILMVQQHVQNGLDVIAGFVGQDVPVLFLPLPVLNGVTQQNPKGKSLVQTILIVTDVGDALAHVLFNSIRYISLKMKTLFFQRKTKCLFYFFSQVNEKKY